MFVFSASKSCFEVSQCLIILSVIFHHTFVKMSFFFFSVAEPGAGFDSRGLGLRAQKKLLGKMSSKKIAMSFIDETTGRVLDNAHKILKQYKQSKKEADKVLKYIIKSVVKVR